MDYYLKTTSKQDFIHDLQTIGIEITLDNNYYQDENIIIDWIGKIPYPIETDQEGNIIGEVVYREGKHVNIRSITELDTTQFVNTSDVYPETPYRVFS